MLGAVAVPWFVGDGMLDVQGRGGEKILDVDGQGCVGSWKLDNFHGRHMCIVPN